MPRLINEFLNEIDEFADYNIYFDESVVINSGLCFCSAIYIKKQNELIISDLVKHFKQKLIKEKLLTDNLELKWTNIKKSIFQNKLNTRKFKKLFRRFIRKINSHLNFDYLMVTDYKNNPDVFNTIKLFILQRLSEKKDLNSKLYKLNFDHQYVYTQKIFNNFKKDFIEAGDNNDRYVIGIKKEDLIVTSKHSTKFTRSKDRLFVSLEGLSTLKEKQFLFYTLSDFMKASENLNIESDKFFFYCQDINSKESPGLFLEDLFVGLFKENNVAQEFRSIYRIIEKQTLVFSIFRISDGNK